MRQNRDKSDLFLSSGPGRPLLDEWGGGRADVCKVGQGSPPGVSRVCLPAEGTAVFFNAVSRACSLHCLLLPLSRGKLPGLFPEPLQNSEPRRAEGKGEKRCFCIRCRWLTGRCCSSVPPPHTYPGQTGTPGGLRRKMFEAPPLPSMRRVSPDSLPNLVGHFLIIFPRQVEPSPHPPGRDWYTWSHFSNLN